MEIRYAFSPRRIARALAGDGLPPGPGRKPWIGLRTARDAAEDPLSLFMRFTRAFGPVYTVRFLGMNLVMCVGPEANRHILLEHPRDFSWRDGFMGDLVPLLGDGLLTTDGPTHDRARKLMNPAFSLAAVKGHAAEMMRMAAAAADKLHTGQELEVYGWMRRLALSIAGRLLFGMRPDEGLCTRLSEQFERGLHYHAVFFHLKFLRGPGTPWNERRAARKELVRILSEEIDARRQAGARGDDILSTLIRAEVDGDRLSDDEILDQVLTLLFAGHDTTTATVSWLMSLLGRHRTWYDRVQAELDALDGDPDGETLVHGLPVLQQCVSETLRLYPPAWIGPRMANQEFELHGYRIPAGTRVAYSSWFTHHLPEVWPDPEAFDPGRFAPERIRDIETGAYVPFGRGPRQCIGMRFGELEVKAVAAALLRRHHLELRPGQLFHVRLMPTLSPRDGVWVTLR